jgi:hypothetical protein
MCVFENFRSQMTELHILSIKQDELVSINTYEM